MVKPGADGEITRLRDVARVELGASRLRAARPARQQAGGRDRRSSSAPGTNALQVSDDVRATMERLKQEFPAGRGLPDRLRPDQSSCASRSNAVVQTLFEAVSAGRARRDRVPADLAGVDHPAGRGAGVAHRHVRGDARLSASRSTRCRCSAWCSPSASSWTTRSWWWRTSSGTSSRACRRARRRDQAMEEVSGPIIAIALVLCAVFVPTAFVSGLTGQFYRQFALTIAISTVISAFNSLTLSARRWRRAAAASARRARATG